MWDNLKIRYSLYWYSKDKCAINRVYGFGTHLNGTKDVSKIGVLETVRNV